MGANPGQMALGLTKGALTGVGQGLQQYGSQNPQFDFSKLQQGLQQARKPPLGQAVTPNAKNITPQTANVFSANPWYGSYT